MTTDRPISIMVVEDDPKSMRRIADAIRTAPFLVVAGTFDTGRAAIQHLEHHRPDVLLTDLGLPDLPGLAVITYCAQRHPSTEIMVLSIYEDETHVLRSLEAGASGYLLKDCLPDEIAERIKELTAGGAPMSPTIARLVLKRLRPSVTAVPVASPSPPVHEFVALTDRELLVLTRIAQGFSYAEIAELTGISPHTVHSHIKNIYSKLSVHSRSQAVFEAGRLGLIDTSLRT